MDKKKKSIEDLENLHKVNDIYVPIHYDEESRNTQASNWRKRCFEMVKEDLEMSKKLDNSILDKELNFSYANQNKSKVRLEDIYQILKQKRIK